MRINPSVIQCDCGSPVLVLNEQGILTCSNPHCVNFEKVFKAIEVKAVRSQNLSGNRVQGSRTNVLDRAINFVAPR